MNSETRMAYSEIYEFINLLDKNEQSKIPQKLKDFFKNEKDDKYIKNINLDIPLNKQNLKRETLSLIALINLKYLETDKTRKEILIKNYKQNEINYRKLMEEKYNPKNMFRENEKIKTISNLPEKYNTKTVIKLKWYEKIIKFIKDIFKRKRK